MPPLGLIMIFRLFPRRHGVGLSFLCLLLPWLGWTAELKPSPDSGEGQSSTTGVAAGAVHVPDPVALPQVRARNLPVTAIENVEEVFDGADLVLHLTEWKLYREIDPKTIGEKVANKRIIDGRNVLDRDLWSNAGWQITYLGKPGSQAAL
ncbi:MAG: hypothetical protein EBU96_09910 [Actinobacteria bacterium]|nr:hypothetical protein [Actinomycetota bacterium]